MALDLAFLLERHKGPTNRVPAGSEALRQIPFRGEAISRMQASHGDPLVDVTADPECGIP